MQRGNSWSVHDVRLIGHLFASFLRFCFASSVTVKGDYLTDQAETVLDDLVGQ